MCALAPNDFATVVAGVGEQRHRDRPSRSRTSCASRRPAPEMPGRPLASSADMSSERSTPYEQNCFEQTGVTVADVEEQDHALASMVATAGSCPLRAHRARIGDAWAVRTFRPTRCTCRRTDRRSRSAPGRARSSTTASRGRTPGRRPPPGVAGRPSGMIIAAICAHLLGDAQLDLLAVALDRVALLLGGGQARLDEAERDGVHVDLELAPLLGERLRQAHHAGLAAPSS